MADAYIYDAVRTPRGKGKKDGSLHEITGLSLATQVLEALRDRNDLDTSKVDDVILGCVTPVGELGADIEIVRADDDSRHRQPPVTGGKNATSSRIASARSSGIDSAKALDRRVTASIYRFLPSGCVRICSIAAGMRDNRSAGVPLKKRL